MSLLSFSPGDQVIWNGRPAEVKFWSHGRVWIVCDGTDRIVPDTELRVVQKEPRRS